MRIISGLFGGRHFCPPADKWPTRPTTDISKEGLFNILQHRLDFVDIRFLDLFGGTGNHSIECISRGCQHATYVDKHVPCVKYIQKLAAEWGFEDSITIHKANVAQFIKKTPHSYDYIFAGPPYPLKWIAEIPDMVLKHELLAEDGLFVMEHNQDHSFQEHPHFEQVRKYGGTFFSFFGIHTNSDKRVSQSLDTLVLSSDLRITKD